MVALTYLAIVAAAVSGTLAAPAAEPYGPDLPDFEVGSQNLARRQDYNQNYRTGGSVNFSPTNNGYSVTFSSAGDFVVGKGWRTGTNSNAPTQNITFTGSTQQTSGTVLVSVYGWTRNPLVEYYIWKHQQVNQPSIQGTSTFWQYISNRVDKRPNGGTVTLANHFAAWQRAGLNLGTHDYQVLATEGWGNAGGNSKYTLST
ncbi:glycoside hydrolase family 11 protein [Coniochaeta sp. 2T2.1]|nr:glycoside hydrolase family 11 protein [Coniochaeta sp. 2T2.1]